MMTRFLIRCGLTLGGFLVAAVCWAQPSGTGTTPATATPTALVTPPEHRRGVEQTFLTYPEWYLVFSPAEYAAFVQHGTPDQFPFLGHIGQFWSGYLTVFEKSRSMGHDLNPGYHLMVMVIGISTTVEYALRAAYENSFGALSQATASAPTAEDRLASRVAQEYVDFIRVFPWYEFDFWRQFKTLWTELPMVGPDMLRKWERRFALSLEYGIKAGYAQLIKLGTQAVYDPALLVTSVQLKPLPPSDPQWPDVHVLAQSPDGTALVTVPRYDAFMRYAQSLASRGADFSEIAGNRSVILVSLVGDTGWRPQQGVEAVLFEQPILTQPGRQRVVVTAKVPTLAQALREWTSAGVQVEHIFDY